MINLPTKNVLQQFFDKDEIISIETFGNGHINDTFKVQTTSYEFILQKVNRSVFDTAALVFNYTILNKAVEQFQKNNGQLLTPRMLTSRSGAFHFIDDEGSAWRKLEFLPKSKSYEITANTNISFAAAQAYGRFQIFLNTIDPSVFQDTIPRFHDPDNRIKQFEASRNNSTKDLLSKAMPEIEQIESFRGVGREIVTLLNSGRLPPSLSHNDTKLNNVIFYQESPFVIDLDTVMKGTLLFDFGDMVRTFCSPVAEDEPDVDKVIFRVEHFEAVSAGYLGVLKNELHPIEKQNLLLGVKAIIYEQALRFLSDYLNGNIYYKIIYPEHNLVRCRTQLKLLAQILQNQGEAQTIINNVLNLQTNNS